MRRTRRAEILEVTLNPAPPRLGIAHWSTRLQAGFSPALGQRTVDLVHTDRQEHSPVSAGIVSVEDPPLRSAEARSALA
jgi:hypothetical protein